ncbi:MAG: hypothetical protein QXG03_12185 [Halalkalicoccus sp.]
MIRFRTGCITLHCTVCDWAASTEGGLDREDVSRMAIVHHCRTGHEIRSSERTDAERTALRRSTGTKTDHV